MAKGVKERELEQLSQTNLGRAKKILEELQLTKSWQEVGGEAHLVGSLRTELLINNLDIDLHVYTDKLEVAASFAVLGKISSKPGVEKAYFQNCLSAADNCLEWHLNYRDQQSDVWQIDIIHLARESEFAGFFERVADKIKSALTAESKAAILEIKYELKRREEKVMSVLVYKAVIEDGVRDYQQFKVWLEANQQEGIVLWEP